MKTSIQYLIAAALLFAAPLATASTYVGTWKNTTFGSTGGLKIDLTVTQTKVSGSFDLDGLVYGMLNPPAIAFSAPLTNGSGTFKANDTAIGDVDATFQPNGKLTVVITDIPGGGLTEGRINGKFNLKLESFSATYEIDDASGLFAEGIANAHVPKAPTIKVDNKVNVEGKSAQVQARVLTNTRITSFKATTTGTAKVSVSGRNPYQILVRKITEPTTKVRITVRNADGFTTSKAVRFVKSKPAAPMPGG